MNKLQEMEVFVRVVESGGISHAGEQLAIAPSAVSRRLKELELRLGVQLIKRSTRQITLTEAGETFYHDCIRLIAELDQVENKLARGQKALAGRIRLAAPVTFANLHLPKAIETYVAKHPDICFDLDLDDHHLDLIGKNIDLAIRIGVLPDSQLKARKIFDVKVVVCAAPTFWSEHGKPETADQLKKLPLIKFSLGKGDAYSYRIGNEEIKSFVPEGQLTHTCNDGQMICQMAKADLGYVIAPTFIVGPYLDSGELVPIMEDYQWGNEQYSGYIVYPATRYLSERARSLLEHLVSFFQNHQF